MKLYTLALAAWRIKADDQIDLRIQNMVGLMVGELELEQEGLRLARQLFPESEGWREHYVIPTEIPQGMQIGSFRLAWQTEELTQLTNEEAE